MANDSMNYTHILITSTVFSSQIHSHRRSPYYLAVGSYSIVYIVQETDGLLFKLDELTSLVIPIHSNKTINRLNLALKTLI